MSIPRAARLEGENDCICHLKKLKNGPRNKEPPEKLSRVRILYTPKVNTLEKLVSVTRRAANQIFINSSPSGLPGVRVFLVVLLAVLLLSSTAWSQSNLLANGGFELGNTSGWTTWGNTIATTTTLKRTGVYSGLVANRTADWQTVVVNALPLVTTGKTYRFSAWVRLAAGTDSSVTLWVAKTDASPRNYTSLQLVTGKAGEWTQLSGEFTYAPTGTATELSIYFQCADATRNLYVDDAEFGLVDNLLLNGGFERGNNFGWSPNGSSLTATTAEKRSGQYSGYVTGRTAEWHTAYRNGLQSVLTSGKAYRVSMWIKPAAGSDIKVELTTRQTNGGVDTYGPVLQQRVCTAGEWTELSGGFKFVNPGNTTALSIYLYCFNATRSYYIDDAEVRLDEVSVDLAATGAAVTQKATGFLHGLSDKLPSTSHYEGLKPRIHRFPAFLGNPNMLPYTPSGESGQSGFSSARLHEPAEGGGRQAANRCLR